MKHLLRAVTVVITLSSMCAVADQYQAAAKKTEGLDACQQGAAIITAYHLKVDGRAGPEAKSIASVVDEKNMEDVKTFVSLAQRANLSPTVSSAAFLFFCQSRTPDPQISGDISPLAQCNSEAWRQGKNDTQPADVKSSISCVSSFFGNR